MKILFSLAIAAFATTSLLDARIPSSAFKPSEYDEAVAKAKESGKPLAVVVTDTASSCPKCQAGNAAVFKRMRSKYVMVVEDEAEKGETLPQDVKQKTYQIFKEKGNFIPIVTVLSENDQRVLGGLCYNQIKEDDRGAFRDLEEEVEKAAAEAPAENEGPSAPAGGDEEAPETEEVCETGELREWTNSDGQTIRAKALAVTATKVTFELESGRVVDYPLSKLTEESREAAKTACE